MDHFAVWGVTCIAVGCGFLVSALRIYLARRRFLATSHAAAGTVVEVRVRGIGRNAVSVPILEFQRPGEQVQRAESWMGSGFQRFEPGQTVPVRYDPADPGRAEVDTFAVMWGLALLRAGYGVLFVLMGSDVPPPNEYQGEIQVVVNPNNANQLVAAANTWDAPAGCGETQAIFWSSDGGAVWNYTCAPGASAFPGIGSCSATVFGSDPALAWDSNNNV